MGALFSYSLSSALILAFLYLVYKWVQAGENSHRLNRVTLLLTYAVSLAAVPSVESLNRVLTAPVTGQIAIETELPEGGLIIEDVTEPTEPGWAVYGLMVYVAGAVWVALMTLWSIFSLAMIIRSSRILYLNGRRIVVCDNVKYAPFSFGNIIVMSSRDFADSAETILLHEESHIRLRHWIDLVIAQAICVFQWYNPAVWLMRRELRTVHEDQADSRVITSGANIREYQMLLIRKAVGARFPSLANSLNHSNLKKRITMMYNQKRSRGALLRPMALVPALCAAMAVVQIPAVAAIFSDASDASVVFNAQSDGKVGKFQSDLQVLEDSSAESFETETAPTAVRKDNAEPIAEDNARNNDSDAESPDTSSPVSVSDEEPVRASEKIAEYPGGVAALMKFLAANIHYPEGTPEGRVIVRFVVGKDGTVRNPEVIRSLSPEADAEAIRVISMLKFDPATNGGQSVASYFTLPLSFKNTKEDSSSKERKEASDMSVYNMTSVSTSTDSDGSVSEESKVTISNVGGKYRAEATGKYEIYINGVKKNWTTEELAKKLDKSKIASMKVDHADNVSKIYVTLK